MSASGAWLDSSLGGGTASTRRLLLTRSLPAVGILAAAGAVLALAGSGIPRVFGVHGGIAFAIAGVRLAIGLTWFKDGRVHVRADNEGLRLGLPPAVNALTSMGAGLAFASSAWVFADPALMDGATAWDVKYAVAAVGAGVLMVVLALVELRKAPHVSLAPDGVVAVGAHGSMRVTWAQVAGVTVGRTEGRGGAFRAMRIDAGNQQVTITEPALGGDAAAVAAMIEHFRTHPQARESLARGVAAIAIVEAAR